MNNAKNLKYPTQHLKHTGNTQIHIDYHTEKHFAWADFYDFPLRFVASVLSEAADNAGVNNFQMVAVAQLQRSAATTKQKRRRRRRNKESEISCQKSVKCKQTITLR